MLLCLEISVLLLLGHSAVRPAAGDCSIPGLVNDLRGACAHSLSHTVQTTQDVKVRLQQAVGDIATLEQTTQKIMAGQQQILQVMQLLQEQLNEIKSRVTAHQEQLTEIQSRVTAHQEQPTKIQQLTTLHPPEDCPADWSRHGQTCYLVSPQLTTGDKAKSVCAALHPTAGLASIHDAASNRHVSQLTEVGDSSWQEVWIGLSRPADGADWSWSDGTPLDFTRWQPGQPDNRGGNENCATTDIIGVWFDLPCSDRYSAMCQIRLG